MHFVFAVNYISILDIGAVAYSSTPVDLVLLVSIVKFPTPLKKCASHRSQSSERCLGTDTGVNGRKKKGARKIKIAARFLGGVQRNMKENENMTGKHQQLITDIFSRSPASKPE